MARQMTGAEMVVEALKDQGVDCISSAIPAARCCRFTTRSSSRTRFATSSSATSRAPRTRRRVTRARPARSACVLVTSGPGATNAITGLTDALMDSIPLVCITGQVPTHLIGSDAFQECGHDRHHPQLHQAQLPRSPGRRSAAHPARGVLRRLAGAGPGLVVIDIPKDVQFATGNYVFTAQHPAQDLSAEARKATWRGSSAPSR